MGGYSLLKSFKNKKSLKMIDDIGVFNQFCLHPQLWDINDGMCKQTFTGHESDINAVAVSTVP